MRPVYTIGHSTRTAAELVTALQAWSVETLVDIRRITRSRTNPQFDEAVLGKRLAKHGIAYTVMPAFGGRRPKTIAAAPGRNAGWDNASFKNYADYADTPPFVEGLAQLMELAAHSTCAIMCSEAVWWRCHRRIVADHLIAHGIPVFHIFTPTKATAAELTAFARVDRRRKTVRYPRAGDTVTAARGSRRPAPRGRSPASRSRPSSRGA
jgi:uncharacterized protein (DUF488 family)